MSEIVWVERPVGDVRPGDDIRLPGLPETQAWVLAFSPGWHVTPGAHVKGWEDRPDPRGVAYLRFAERDEPVALPAGTRVEIGVPAEELPAIEGLGWWNRIQTEHEGVLS